MTGNSNQTVLLRINNLKHLPVLSEDGFGILNAINDPDISIDRLVNVLSSSPALVARLLGLANSAYFGLEAPVNDLPTAIYRVLGLDLVKIFALSLVLKTRFDARACPTFNSGYYWRRSLHTAIAAQKIAKGNNDLPRCSSSAIYASGLLLYIGVLVLAHLEPADMNDILLRGKLNGGCVGEEIKLQFGQSHYYFGYTLFQKWRLSSLYQSVMKNFEDNDYIGEERPLINLLILGHYLGSRIVDNREIDYPDLEKLGERLSISTATLPGVVEELMQNTRNIDSLVSILDGD